MLAKDLKPKDVFTVAEPDPECDVRVCLTNDAENGLRFGFPNRPGYWCYMGERVEVTKIEDQ